MAKNKCSTCGMELDNLDDLIMHEAEHESGGKQTDFKGPEADNAKQALSPLAEFDGECVGGLHKFHMVMKLYKEKIDVVPIGYYAKFILSIPYKSISEVQVLTGAQTSSFLAIGNNSEMLALTAGVSLLSNILLNKPKLFLVLTFKDEFGIEQSVAFKMKKAEEAQHSIYDKVAQAQRLMHNTCRRCGECAPISMLRRNGGYCDFCMKG